MNRLINTIDQFTHSNAQFNHPTYHSNQPANNRIIQTINHFNHSIDHMRQLVRRSANIAHPSIQIDQSTAQFAQFDQSTVQYARPINAFTESNLSPICERGADSSHAFEWNE